VPFSFNGFTLVVAMAGRSGGLLKLAPSIGSVYLALVNRWLSRWLGLRLEERSQARFTEQLDVALIIDQ
jgi:hypothetical protein